MKKILVVIMLLGSNTVARADVYRDLAPDKFYTSTQTKTILSDCRDELAQLMDSMAEETLQPFAIAEFIGQLMDSVKDDAIFLRKVVKKYSRNHADGSKIDFLVSKSALNRLETLTNK